MLCNKKCKVGVLCLLLSTFIAVSVNCYNAVSVLINYNSIRIHTECSNKILKFLCSVYNLAFIQFIRKMCKNNCRKLNSHTDIHTVRLCWNLKLLTDIFNPFASASANGNNTFVTVHVLILIEYSVAAINHFNIAYRSIKIEVYMVLHLIVHILKNNIVNICSKMSY